MSELSIWQLIVFGAIGVAIVTLLLTIIISFGVALVSLAQMIFRSGYPWEEPEDEKLSWVQRVGKRQTRGSLMLISPRFAKERRRLAISTMVFLSSFAVFATFGLLTKTHN